MVLILASAIAHATANIQAIENVQTVEKGSYTLRISAAKSFADTGMLQALIERFKVKKPHINIEFQAVGSLQALDHVRNAQADLVITHYPHEEKRLVAQGYASKRTQIMFSKYAVFGPTGDEMGLARKKNIFQVLRTLAEEQAPYVVSSPKGGTYRKIEELWALAGINPDWPGYEYTNLSSSSILRQAADLEAYAISDMGTYLANKEELSDWIVPVFQNDLALQNLYSVLIVTSDEKVDRNEQYVQEFYDYLISDEGQERIRQIGEELFNAAIVTPAATLDPELRALREAQQLQKEKYRLLVVTSLLSLLVIVLLFFFFQSRRIQKVERKRLEGETRYRDLVETTPDWVWEVDANGVFTYASPRVVQLLGYSAEEIIGRKVIDLLPVEMLECDEKNFFHITANQQAFYNQQCTRRHKDGHLVVTESSGLPIFSDNGDFLGYRGIERDITERKAAQEALRKAHDELEVRVEERTRKLTQEVIEREKAENKAEAANKAKSMFLANMSHELRTPMHGILSFAKFGQEKIGKVADEKLLFYFEQINSSGERLLELLNDLLDLAKLESGKIDMKFQPGNLSNVIRDCVKEQAVRIETLGLSIEIDQCNDAGVPMQFDTVRMGQVVTNLLSNAIKFSVRGSTIHIGCKSTTMEIDSNTVGACECYVSNQGDQIPEKDLQRIFGKFNQSDTNTYVAQKGTGLGLSISREIIMAHKGRIWAENLGENEVIFKFIIPQSQQTETPLVMKTA